MPYQHSSERIMIIHPSPTAAPALQPWRIEPKTVAGKRGALVVRGYGSAAEYMRDKGGLTTLFSLADARAAIAKANAGARTAS